MLGGCQALTGATVHESVGDTKITTRVKAALPADKGFSLTRGGVETTRGFI
jgi:osmotically-inducible protein OsmY